MPLGGPGEILALRLLRATMGGYVMAGITNSFGAGAEDAWLAKVGLENATAASGDALETDQQKMINGVRLQH